MYIQSFELWSDFPHSQIQLINISVFLFFLLLILINKYFLFYYNLFSIRRHQLSITWNWGNLMFPAILSECLCLSIWKFDYSEKFNLVHTVSRLTFRRPRRWRQSLSVTVGVALQSTTNVKLDSIASLVKPISWKSNECIYELILSENSGLRHEQMVSN